MENKINFGEMQFNLPKNQSNVIKVIGVGGGGSNAVNHMYRKGIEGVDFVVCNTDSQALNTSPVPIKIQLGATLTEGLGAGANPEVGMESALESKEAIESMLGEKTKMVFITVGMGGGTGTGAAPIIAKIARDMGLLTVAIVTTPFAFEGRTRNDQALLGVDQLREFVDSIIVINNNKLREVYGNLGFKSGFSKADEVLSTAAMGIANVITKHYTQNIDFRDANTVLANSGSAIMGSAKAEGENRAQDAITKALDSPLLNDNKITGAKNVLLLIVSGTNEITLDEIGEINDYIQSEAKTNVNIIMGVGENDELGDSVEVTIVATGFNKEQQTNISTVESKKIVYNLDDDDEVKTTKRDTTKSTDRTKGTENPTSNTLKIAHQLDDKVSQPLTLFDIEKEDLIIENTITETPIEQVKADADTPDKNDIGLGSDFLSLLSGVSDELPFVEFKDGDKVIKQSDLIPTTDLIKNIHVVYDEVIADVDDLSEFIITPAIADIEVIDLEVVKPDEERIKKTFFDLPIAAIKKENDVEFLDEMFVKADLDEAKQIEVVDTEIVSTNKVHNLEDFMLEVNPLKAVIKKEKIVAEPELKIETKIVAEDVVELIPENEISPLNSTINELKKRADERRSKMKQHNYDFNKNVKKNIDELEKQPAYKRNNIELNENPTDSNITRTSLDVDGDNLNFRSNNSFLHDNVD